MTTEVFDKIIFCIASIAAIAMITFVCTDQTSATFTNVGDNPPQFDLPKVTPTFVPDSPLVVNTNGTFDNNITQPIKTSKTPDGSKT
jgi:hypothetical protein